ncbi:Urb2/Npa2 family-domain-containing protein [Polychytrium aggregatum]|uniref:Urb2/Npa2 family-domain-containing protein n=1 Tax=Polychytrium aggregatum TaxID=110093 RepID=UPI0022FF3643|nr:Urb2/Npa2 family-domain-containing protein [Polychytrium aggregatum]KAI9204356.1 Urb2/Npa2 family-domain-containing protein [Polychytrium aggregatum]
MSVKPFSKHVAFLLAEFISIQTSSRPIHPRRKHDIVQGIYALLDLCGEHGREMMLAAADSLGSGGRDLFKSLVSEWEKSHRFKGKV